MTNKPRHSSQKPSRPSSRPSSGSSFGKNTRQRPKPQHKNKGATGDKSAKQAALASIFDGATGAERIAKKIAHAGFCSRRDAERWIEEGRVSVNGQVLLTPAYNASPEDIITVDGKPLQAAETPRLWRYYKPRGLVVSHRDEKDRDTVFDHLPHDLPRVVSVGRLDLDSEGLLLLTNSGDLARHLELPDTGWTRKYRVRVRGHVEAEKLNALEHGITIDGVRYRGVEAQIDRQMGSNAWLTVVLREGKNREIRKIMEHLGYPVSRLIRISFGPFKLNQMEEGTVEEVKTNILRDQLGLPRLKERPDTEQKNTRAKRTTPTKNKTGQIKNANHQRQKTRRPTGRS